MIGTFAAFAWSIASRVCGITPSSAATPSTTMSVTFAPRARIRVNASWPGVSTNTTLFSPNLHFVRADVLRDASGFARRHIRQADPVEQAGLSVVYVAPHRNHGRPRLQIFLGLFPWQPREPFLLRGTRRLTTPLNDWARSVAVCTSSAWLMLANTRSRSRSVFKRSFARTSSFFG